jgi:hypothetical protein
MTTITDGTPDFDVSAPLDTDADVLERVDRLIGEDARRDRSLWLFFLTADAVQLPVVVPIDDVPVDPDPGTAGNICDLIARVLNDAAPGGSAVITLVVGDGRGVTDSDRQWFAAVRTAAAMTGVRLRMLCLATGDGVLRPAA